MFITPAIRDAGWDSIRQIRREVTLTSGPIIVRGNPSSRNKKKKKFADYVLYWKPNVPVVIVEAKDNKHTVSQSLQQALRPLGGSRAITEQHLQLSWACIRGGFLSIYTYILFLFLCSNGQSCLTAMEIKGNVQKNAGKVRLDFGDLKENIKVDNKNVHCCVV